MLPEPCAYEWLGKAKALQNPPQCNCHVGFFSMVNVHFQFQFYNLNLRNSRIYNKKIELKKQLR